MGSKSFVVVGGTSGIGLEITRRMAAKAYSVVAISRSAGSVAKLPGVTHLPVDVTGRRLMRVTFRTGFKVWLTVRVPFDCGPFTASRKTISLPTRRSISSVLSRPFKLACLA